MNTKRIMVYVWILVCAAFIAAPVMAADQSDLAGRAATWEKEYNADNLNAVAAMYAADGCRMPPNAETAKGTAAIVAQLKSSKEQGGAKVKIAVTSAETMGNMGWGTGTYEITGADGTHMDHGKWMDVSKKEGTTWKFQCDIWNSNMTLPATPKK